ncbi:MAG: signal peptidase I [Planctomycetes bacterium]|nr:signal peptidase I [Planctomycetota bacterium]
MTTTNKPKGYAKVPAKLRRVIADVSNIVAALGVIVGVGVAPEIPGLWLRIPALVAAGGLAIACWFVHRRLGEKAPPPLRAGVALAAAGAALLAMTFHKAGGYTSLAGLLCFISVLTARGSLDIEKPHTPQDWRRTGWSTLRDNIESIAGSLIIVLIVWHFCLEAFKIPTGSMLPTLYGDQVWGDRVLVDKFAYEFGDPKRWEPVVFRYPLRRTDPYVKRCIALPGEQVMIAQGDIYVRKTPTSEVELLQKTGEAREVLWYPVIGPVTSGKQMKALFARPGDKVEFTNGVIQFGAGGDTMFFPKDGSGKQDNVRDHDPSGQGQVSEEIGYNRRIVGDLRLRARVITEKLKSPLEFVLVRDDDEYALRFETGACTLLRRKRTGEKTYTDWHKLEAPGLKDAMASQNPEFEFSLADGQLVTSFKTGAKIALVVSSPFKDAINARDTELAKQGKVLTGLLSTEAFDLAEVEPAQGRRGQVRVSATGEAAVEILGIDRDVYYVGRVLQTREGNRELPFAVTLKDDQYFVLGDNSPGSKDTRFWIEVIIEQNDGTAVVGGLDDQGQYIAHLLDRGREKAPSALTNLQWVARFSHSERGLDQPSNEEVLARAVSVLKQEAQKERLAAIPFITIGGHDVQVEVSKIKALHVRLVPYVERDLFVGRPFAVFLWPNRMKLID